jgi:DNA-binding NtrC family response regulator
MPHNLSYARCVGGLLMPTVLLVEDEVQILIFTESVLQKAGYETLTAATVAEAQAIINSDRKVDLVFLDVTLANHPEGGITIGKMVDKSRQGLPVLYTSGRELTDGMKSLFALNNRFLPKPYTEHQLLEAIAGMLAATD